MEKVKISSIQMAIMMHPTITATGILLVPAMTAEYARQDLWISPMWASLAGFLIVIIINKLHQYFPGETIIQYSRKVFGEFLGKLIGLFILFFYLHINAIILREYGEFVIGTFLTNTPMVVVIGSMVLVSAYAVRGGLEVMARTAQIFVPIVILLLFVIGVLLLPELEPRKMLPIMERGIYPSLRGAVVPSTWFTEFCLLSFLLPYVKHKEKSLRWGMIAVFAVMIMMVGANLFTLFLFGKSTNFYVYPVMNATRYISVADFLEHLEATVMTIWVTGAFVKISVFYYVIAIGTAQWLSLPNFRPLVLPLGFLLTVWSLWSADSIEGLSHFLEITGPFYFFSIQMLLPMLLLFVAFFRKRRRVDNG